MISDQSRQLVVILGIILVTFLVYGKTLDAGLVYDDLALIPNNSINLGDTSKIKSYFTSGVWNHTNAPYADGSLYRPVWLLWDFLVHHFAGEAPFGWHLSSMLLHGLIGYLLFLLFLLIGQIFPDCHLSKRFIAASIFLIHPAASQSVAWISGSTDLVATFFILLSFLTYISYVRRDYLGLYALSLLMFAMGILSKEVAIALLPALLFFDQGRLRSWQTLPWRAYSGFLLVLLAYFLARRMVLQGVNFRW